MVTAKSVKGLSSVLLITALLLAAPQARADGIDPALSRDEISQIAQEAYVYGLQQVVFYETRYAYTQLESSDFYSGNNNLWWLREPISPDFRVIVTPNATTLYGAGFLDLSKEPVVVELPAIEDLYFTYQLMDQYGDYFFYAGNQFTGREERKFIVVGPGWQGKMPEQFAGVQVVKAPSDAAFAIVRHGLLSYDRSEVEKIGAYQEATTMTPLGLWLENGGKGIPKAKRTPVAGGYETFPRMAKLDKRVVESLDGLDFFKLLSLVLNDPTMTKRTDSVMEVETLARIARLGIGEGLQFNPESLDTKTRDALVKGFETGRVKVRKGLQTELTNMNGWMLTRSMGDYGTDYFLRAIIAHGGWGGPGIASHTGAFCFFDSEGNRLDGSKQYELTFDTVKLPPTTEFWSIPIYDMDGYFVENEIKRYTVNSFSYKRGDYHVDDDGKLVFYIQRQKPADATKAKNWLPAPAGPFRFAARFYGPHAPLIDGSYPMPQPVMVGEGQEM